MAVSLDEALGAGLSRCQVRHRARTGRWEPVGRGRYLRLSALPDLDDEWRYREVALFGKDEGGGLAFWSFTNDGKRSRGKLSDGSDVYPDAVAFEAQMPQGLARMIYWPAEDGEGFYFAVESRTKKGWNRFMRHRYRAI